jgi:hypothetical protein
MTAVFSSLGNRNVPGPEIANASYASKSMHPAYPIDNMLTLLQANCHLDVDIAGPIWSYPLKEVTLHLRIDISRSAVNLRDPLRLLDICTVTPEITEDIATPANQF